MKIIKAWMIERVRETRWPRGQKAQVFPKTNPLSPVVANVGLPGSKGGKGDKGDPGDISDVPDPGDLTLIFDNQLI